MFNCIINLPCLFILFFLGSILSATAETSDSLKLVILEKEIEIDHGQIDQNDIEVSLQLKNLSSVNYIIYEFNNHCGRKNTFGVEPSVMESNPSFNRLIGLWVSVLDTKTDNFVGFIIGTSSNSNGIKKGLLDQSKRDSTIALIKERYGDWNDPKYSKLYKELTQTCSIEQTRMSRNEIASHRYLMQKLEISPAHLDLRPGEYYIIVEYRMNESIYNIIEKRKEKLFIGSVKSNRVRLIVK